MPIFPLLIGVGEFILHLSQTETIALTGAVLASKFINYKKQKGGKK